MTSAEAGDLLAHPDSDVIRAVGEGLSRTPKRLPAWLFYDAAGSRLFDRITTLPEYYLTRAERLIFETHADAIVRAALAQGDGPLTVVELGAGSATKTEILLAALLRAQAAVTYQPIDVASEVLRDAARRLASALPGLHVAPRTAHYTAALAALAAGAGRRLVLFIGSSIGNLDDDEAGRLLLAVHDSLGPGGALLLGTDLAKAPELLLPAYDDAAGVTAAFNRNVLVRINRELDADFEPALFRHVALWNPGASRVEMHLESLRAHTVTVGAIAALVPFAAGERIHTESSAKYDLPRVEALLGRAGLARVRTWTDRPGAEARVALHLAAIAGA
jgi:dimethylhistidine N-methyltransferase